MLLKCEDVQGKNVLTNFAGMDFTTDKLRSLVRKWFSLIETFVDVKTTDGYSLRVFCIGFTKRRMDQAKRTCYAQSGQIRQIRKKMNDIISRECSSCDLKECVLKFIPEVIGKEIEKVCQGIYPLQNVYIRKVKILKSPKFDVTKLLGTGPCLCGGKLMNRSAVYAHAPSLEVTILSASGDPLGSHVIQPDDSVIRPAMASEFFTQLVLGEGLEPTVTVTMRADPVAGSSF